MGSSTYRTLLEGGQFVSRLDAEFSYKLLDIFENGYGCSEVSGAAHGGSFAVKIFDAEILEESITVISRKRQVPLEFVSWGLSAFAILLVAGTLATA